MARKHMQLLVLAAFLSVVTCISINDVLIPRINTKNEKVKEEDFSYIVKTKKNISCILADMSINITVPYKPKDNNESIQVLLVPRNASTDGSNCSDIISTMKLTWKADGDKNNKDNVITFVFLNDHVNFSLFSINTSIYLDKNNFPNATTERLEYTSEKDLRLFVTPVQNRFHRCNKTITRTGGKHELIISNVSLIAFNSVKDISSHTETTCSDKAEKTETFPYVLKEDKRNCSLARMSISLNISYFTKDSKVQYGIISVPSAPSDVDVSGICGDSLSQMYLTWSVKNENQSTLDSKSTENQIVFNFLKNKGIASVSAISFDIFLDEKNFPNNAGRISRQTPITSNNFFSTPADNGLYSCANVTTFNFDDSTMNISDVLLVAFNAEQDFSLKTVVDCKSQFALSKENFNYFVLDEDPDVACILANMTIAMKIPYKKTDLKVVNKTIVPNKISATGSCRTMLSVMNLAWSVPMDKTKMNTITFYVIQKENQNQNRNFSVLQIEATIYLDEQTFPGVYEKDKLIKTASAYELNLFSTPANGLYNCTNVHTIRMNDVEMNISNVVFVAFNTVEDLSSKMVQGCNNGTDISTTTPTVPTTSSTIVSSIITDQPTTESSTKSTPPPDPSVEAFKYYLMNLETKVACTMANMTISLKVPYEMKNSGKNTTKLDVPLKPKIGGKCGDASSTMEFTWKETEDTFDTVATENVVTFTFKKDDSKFAVHAVNVSIYMDEKNFPNAKKEKQRQEALAEKITLFSTPVKELFRCTPQTQIKAGDVEVTISEVALIAFNAESKVSWKSEQNCVTAEEGSDVGAIVGGIIGCLIFIGLIAFGIIMYRKRRRMA